MRAALQAGLGIPSQLSVVGFDGIPEGARCWPGLTTVRQPMREMGRVACENLRRQIENPEEGAASTVTYRMDLLVRESSGPPPG
jgi:LacI family transcriptional regulator